MNIHEIYICNSALDGKDIPFLPSQDTVGLSGLMADAVKDGMVEKGLLQSHSAFTDRGILITDRLLRYKEAGKHVKIGSMAFGIQNDRESILISFNPYWNEYDIKVVDSSDSANQLSEGCRFLSPDFETVDREEIAESLNYEEFTEKHALTPWNHFRLTMIGAEDRADEIYLAAENRLYVYDCENSLLRARARQWILSHLAERMRAA